MNSQELCAATEDKPLSCLLEIEADSKIVSKSTYVNYTLNSSLLYLAVKNTATTGVSLKRKADERFAMTAEHTSLLCPPKTPTIEWGAANSSNPLNLKNSILYLRKLN